MPTTSSGSYQPGQGGTGSAAAVDNTQIPPLDASIAGETIPTAAPTPASQVTQSTVLDALAKQLGVHQKVGQNLEDLVIAKLQQLPHKGNAPARAAANNGGGMGGAIGWLGHSIQGIPDFVGKIPGEVTHGDSGANQFIGDNIKGLVSGLEGANRALTGAGRAGEGAASTALTGHDLGGKNPPKKGEKGKGLGKDNIPGSQGRIDQSNAPPDTTNTPSSGKAAVIAKIAHDLGAPGSDLTAIATKLNVPGIGQSPLATGAGQNENGQTVYTAFWKRITSDQAYKAQWVTALEKANLLDASQNNGAPDNATVAGAFQNLLKASVAYKSPPEVMVQAADNHPQQNSSGTDITGTTSELQAFVQGEAEKLGVNMSPMQILSVANKYKNDASTNGTSGIQDELKNDIVQYYNPNDPANPPGAANDMYIQIQATAAKYGIPADPTMIKSMVVNALTNSAGDAYSIAAAAKDAAAAAEQHFQQLAAGAYPALAGQIQSGQDVATLIAPYNAITAQYTGKDPATLANPGVDPTSPDYKFLQGAKDPKTGQTTMMTMDEWKQYIMQHPEYGFQNTSGGKALASQMTSAILNAFGKVKTEDNPGSFSSYTGSMGNTPGTYNS